MTSSKQSVKPQATTAELWQAFLACEKAAITARAVYDGLESAVNPDHEAIFKAQELLADADIAEDAAHEAYELSILADDARA